MDLIAELGPLAIGSRLKRLGNRFFEESSDVYRHFNFELQARYFPLLYLLHLEGSASVTDAARGLQLTHPAVSQMVQGLSKEGWIVTAVDPDDDRRKVLTISEKGKKLIGELIPIWDRIRAAVEEVLGDRKEEFLETIAAIERELDDTKFSTRVVGRRSVEEDRLVVTTWDPEYAQSFHDLNEEWVRRFFHYEKVDEAILKDPQQHILDTGGEVFFVLCNGDVAGTGALMKTGVGSYELVKMAVSRKFQGCGVGSYLMEYILDWAQKKGADEVTLETNSQLKGALKLYRRYGFKKVPNPNGKSEYERADVFMTLVFAQK